MRSINHFSSSQRISKLNSIQSSTTSPSNKNSPAGQDIVRSKHRGIGGITKKIEDVRENDDRKIDTAFQEGLQGLSKAAKDMIELSEKIKKSMKEKTGGISEDETTNLRAALLSLGLEDKNVENNNGITSGDTNENLKYFNILKKEAERKGGVLQNAV